MHLGAFLRSQGESCGILCLRGLAKWVLRDLPGWSQYGKTSVRRYLFVVSIGARLGLAPCETESHANDQSYVVYSLSTSRNYLE